MTDLNGDSVCENEEGDACYEIIQELDIPDDSPVYDINKPPKLSFTKVFAED